MGFIIRIKRILRGSLSCQQRLSLQQQFPYPLPMFPHKMIVEIDISWWICIRQMFIFLHLKVGQPLSMLGTLEDHVIADMISMFVKDTSLIIVNYGYFKKYFDCAKRLKNCQLALTMYYNSCFIIFLCYLLYFLVECHAMSHIRLVHWYILTHNVANIFPNVGSDSQGPHLRGQCSIAKFKILVSRHGSTMDFHCFSLFIYLVLDMMYGLGLVSFDCTRCLMIQMFQISPSLYKTFGHGIFFLPIMFYFLCDEAKWLE